MSTRTSSQCPPRSSQHPAPNYHARAPVREGSTFLTVCRGMESELTISGFDRPERLVVAATNDRMDIDCARCRPVARTASWPTWNVPGSRASRLRLFVEEDVLLEVGIVDECVAG